MRMISTGVAAAFLFASSFGAFAAPAASSAQGVKTEPGAIIVQNTMSQDTKPAAKTPMHRKSSMHGKKVRHRTSMHHKTTHRKTAKLHTTHKTKTMSKGTSPSSSTY
jgi:hypothetical protein